MYTLMHLLISNFKNDINLIPDQNSTTNFIQLSEEEKESFVIKANCFATIPSNVRSTCTRSG